MTNEDQNAHFLVGKFFLSASENRDEHGRRGINWQGQVISVDYVNNEIGMVAMCNLYGWITGSVTCAVLIKLSDMIVANGDVNFKFFDNVDGWREAGEKNRF